MHGTDLSFGVILEGVFALASHDIASNGGLDIELLGHDNEIRVARLGGDL